MKRKITIMIIVTSFVLTLAACGPTQNNEITTHEDMILFDYKDLKDRAQLIVEVSVLDDLMEENSQFILDNYDEDQPIIDQYALRKVKILETYKNKTNQSDSVIDVIEPAAIKEEQLYVYDDYEPLKKGDRYILFINNQTASGGLSIISGDNGKVNMEDITKTNSEFYHIAAKTLIEFETDLPSKEKEKLIHSKIQEMPANINNEKTVKTKDGEITIKYKEKANDCFYVKMR